MSERAVGHLEWRADGEAVDITPFVEHFEWSESMIHGGFSWDMQFTAEAWREWDRIMFGRETPTYQFRLRSVEGESFVSTEWRTAITDKSRASFSQDVSMVGLIKGGDRRLNLAQGSPTRVYENVTAASVLRQIAQRFGLNAAVQDTGPTDTWSQTRMSDWAFARRVARHAATTAGRCDTYLWLDEDTLRFEAPTLTGASERRYDLDVVESRVDGWVGTYNGRDADRRGAATLRGVGFNFGSKTGIVFNMNEGAASSQPGLAARVPRRMSDGLRVFPVFEDTAEQVEQVVRARWGRYAPRYLGVTIRTRPDLTVRPGQIISLEANIDTRRETPFMGRYVCLEVRHVLTKGSIVTYLTCYRREAQEGDDNPTGANADNAATRDRQVSGGTRAPRTILVATEIG